MGASPQSLQESQKKVQKSRGQVPHEEMPFEGPSLPVHWGVHIAPGWIFGSQKNRGYTGDGTWCLQSSEG